MRVLAARPPSRRPVSQAAVAGIATLSFLILAWVALVVWSAPFFRGSDQTWYVEDVRTIMAGAPAHAHEVYPFSLVGPDRRFDTARPFIHNVPVLWVWAAVANAAGGDPHTGVLVVNILCCLGAAGFVYLASRRFVSQLVALAAAVTMLYTPLFFWIAGQDLAEPFSAVLIAAAVYLAVRWPRRLAAWLGAEALVAVAAVGRIWTLPLLLVLPVGLFVLDEGRARAGRIGRATIALAAGATVYLPVSALFPSYVPSPTVLALMDVSLASNNMILYFTTTPWRTTTVAGILAGLFRNAYLALGLQTAVGSRSFWITRWLPAADMWPVNLTVLVAVSGFFLARTDRLRRLVMALAVIAFGIHATTSVLLQNQPRYLVPLLPPIVIGATVAAGLWLDRGRTHPRVAGTVAALLCVTIATFAAVDVFSAQYFRADAMDAARRRTNVSALLDQQVPASARVALDTSFGARWPADWAIYPRQELALGTDFRIPDPDYERMIRLFRPAYLVTDATSGLPSALRRLGLGYPEYVGESGLYTLWRLAPGVQEDGTTSEPVGP